MNTKQLTDVRAQITEAVTFTVRDLLDLVTMPHGVTLEPLGATVNPYSSTREGRVYFLARDDREPTRQIQITIQVVEPYV